MNSTLMIGIKLAHFDREFNTGSTTLSDLPWNVAMKRPQYLSIKTKLILAFLGGMVVPLTFVILYSLYASAKIIEERILKQVVSEVQVKAREIESFLKETERDVVFLSESALFQDLIDSGVSRDSEEFERLRRRVEGEFLIFSRGKRAYYQIRYIDERGMEIVRLNFDGQAPLPVPKEKLQNKGNRYYFQEAMALPPGQIYISPMDLNIEHGFVEIPHRPVVRYATPVANRLGERRGVVIINIFADSLFALIKDLPPQGEAFLVNRSGRYLARFSFSDSSEQSPFEKPKSLKQDYPGAVVSQVLSGNPGTVHREIDSIISYAPVHLSDSQPDHVWIVAVGSSKSLIYDTIRSKLGAFAFITLATLTGAMSLGLLFARHFSRPLLELCRATEVIAQGDYTHRVGVRRGDELGDLGKKFNLMAEKLGDWQKRLQQWNEELQTEVERRTHELKTSEEMVRLEKEKLEHMVRGIGAGLCLIDRQMKIVWANKTLQEDHGGREMLLGQPCYTALWKSHQPCHDCICHEVFKDGELRKGVFVRRGSLGEEQFYQIVATPVKNSLGEVEQILELFLNITDSVLKERKMLEQLAQADRLASLGQLASGVLHEVANPLAAIKTTIQVMEEDTEREEHHEKYLRRIIREIDRLNRFLKTFSSFARPRKPDFGSHFVPDLFREVSLLVREDARKKRVDLEEDHRAGSVEFLCDGAQIGQLLLNLILNALDAMPEGGKIIMASDLITSDVTPDFLRFTISDTGMGIPQEKISKIFNPFFTTKTKGTGLGLSIVHQIVKDHRGSINVISEAGKGTTFMIDFPLSPSSFLIRVGILPVCTQ
ncbi:MAG: HAMP domain-containing protein [Candidatus Tectomicrobia bacterium]|nr:HAMP domain-containing protein [Candidatus Tectomicrobia bacterium]